MQIEFETSEHDPFLAKIITNINSFFIHVYWRITHNFFFQMALFPTVIQTWIKTAK